MLDFPVVLFAETFRFPGLPVAAVAASGRALGELILVAFVVAVFKAFHADDAALIDLAVEAVHNSVRFGDYFRAYTLFLGFELVV